MAYGLIGDAAIDRANYRGPNQGWTWIAKTTPAASRGILKKTSVYINQAGNLKIKVFRDDGTNYVYIGESPTYNCSVGLNELDCWIPVEKGDFIGFYIPNPGAAVDCGTVGEGGTSSVYQAGDITTTTLKTAWTTSNSYMSVQGKVFARVAPF